MMNNCVILDKESAEAIFGTEAERTAARIAKSSEGLTSAREITDALYTEALDIAQDHGTRSEGAIAAILATLTTAYFSEIK